MYIALQTGDLGSATDVLYLDDQINYRIPIVPVQAGSQTIPGGVGFGVHERGIYRSQLTATRAGTREILIPILITGASLNGALEKWARIDQKLEQARRAQGPYARGGRILLVAQFTGASQPAAFDVVDGSFLPADLALPDGDLWLGGLLSLSVYPYVRTAPVSYAASATLTMAGNVFQLGIPGSVESPLTFKVADTGALIAVPAHPTLSDIVTGGTLNFNTTYSYRITATTPAGETTVSTNQTILTANDANATHQVHVSWALVPGATGYKVYGRTAGGELLMATIVGMSTLSWTDTGSVTPAGAQPGANTARVVLNRLHAARVSLRPQASGDYTGLYSTTAVSPGASTTDGTQYGAGYNHVTLTQTFTTFCSAVSAGGALDNGLLADVYLRVRDAAPVIGDDVLAAPTIQPGAGTLTDGIYTFFTIPKNGAVFGQISNQVTATVQLINAGGTQAVPTTVLFYDNDTTNDFRFWTFQMTGAVATTSTTIWDGSTHNVFDMSGAAGTGAGGATINGFAQTAYGGAIGLPGLPASGVLSVRVRFKANGNMTFPGANYTPMMLVGHSIPGAGTACAGIFATSANNIQVTVPVSPTTSTIIVYSASAAVFNDGNWHVFEATYDATGTDARSTLYIDGSPIIGQVSSGAFPPLFLAINGGAPAGNLYIGEIVVADHYLGNTLSVAGGSAATVGITPGLSATGHDLFISVDDGSNGWYKVALGNVTTYQLTQWPPASATLQSYPSSNTPVLNAELRLGLEVNGSGAQPVFGPAVSTQVANSEWELLYMGTYPLSTVMTPEGQSAPNWKILVQGRNPGPGSYTCDVDLLAAFPHDEDQIIADFPGGTTPNTTLYTWQLDTRYDGRVSVLLLDGGGAVQANAMPIGRMLAGPADNKFFVIGETADQNGNRICDAINCKFTAQIARVGPRYHYLIGQQV